MKKIEKLTPEQETLLPTITEKWISHGLSTHPADRAEAEADLSTDSDFVTGIRYATGAIREHFGIQEPNGAP